MKTMMYVCLNSLIAFALVGHRRDHRAGIDTPQDPLPRCTGIPHSSAHPRCAAGRSAPGGFP